MLSKGGLRGMGDCGTTLVRNSWADQSGDNYRVKQWH